MMVKLRKVRGVPGGGPSSDLYEWQPQGSKKWYFVHLLKIIASNGHVGNEKLEENQLINQLFNAMLMNLTVTIQADYNLDTKRLTLHL